MVKVAAVATRDSFCYPKEGEGSTQMWTGRELKKRLFFVLFMLENVLAARIWTVLVQIWR